MTGSPPVLLDACVLVNFALCDTLLRLAEPPRLFAPKWSSQIMEETTRTLRNKLAWPDSLVDYFESQLRVHFTDAWIEGYQEHISQMTNEPKDRHVVAAAVHAGAPIILTFNLRHFRRADLASWRVTALHPQQFLVELYRQEPELVLSKLKQQASDRHRTLDQLLAILNPLVPEFVSVIAGNR